MTTSGIRRAGARTARFAVERPTTVLNTKMVGGRGFETGPRRRSLASGASKWDVLHTGGTAMSDKKKSARSTRSRVSNLLSDEERAAMKETLKERRRALSGEADGESDALAKIAEMAEPDHGMARRLHNVIKANAPTLSPKTWYGMPAYAKDGKVVCFFQSGQKFKSRYATLGFQDAANLDDGDIWPTSFALKRLTAAVEEKIGKLVKRAAS